MSKTLIVLCFFLSTLALGCGNIYSSKHLENGRLATQTHYKPVHYYEPHIRTNKRIHMVVMACIREAASQPKGCALEADLVSKPNDDEYAANVCDTNHCPTDEEIRSLWIIEVNNVPMPIYPWL